MRPPPDMWRLAITGFGFLIKKLGSLIFLQLLSKYHSNYKGLDSRFHGNDVGGDRPTALESIRFVFRWVVARLDVIDKTLNGVSDAGREIVVTSDKLWFEFRIAQAENIINH